MSIGVYLILVYLHSAPIEWLFTNVFSNSKHSFTTIRSDQAMFAHNCICLQIVRQSLTSSVAQSILSQCHFNTLIFQFFSPVEESLTFLVTKAYSQWYVYFTIVFAFLYRANRRSLTYSVTQNILSQWYVRRCFLLTIVFVSPHQLKKSLLETIDNLFSNSRHFIQFAQEKALYQGNIKTFSIIYTSQW
jgi:hypothetical protein